MDIISTLLHCDPKPDTLEAIILLCTIITCISYIFHIWAYDNSRIISWATLILILLTILGTIIAEISTKKRWFMLIQCFIALILISYITHHRVKTHLSNSG
jgi:hypothetical protein